MLTKLGYPELTFLSVCGPALCDSALHLITVNHTHYDNVLHMVIVQTWTAFFLKRLS